MGQPEAKGPVQVKGPMKVKGPTEAKGPTEVNFKHGGIKKPFTRSVC